MLHRMRRSRAERQPRSTRSHGLVEGAEAKGYGLLCVARAVGPLEAETQDEDEVYELQFGRHFGKGRVTTRIPIEEE